MSLAFPIRIKTRSRGFTLIELLVVVAIIALLAAILFPVFSRARENARRSSCQSNLKQIGLGLLQYTQDNDERLVFGWFSSTQNYGINGTAGPGTNGTTTQNLLDGVDHYTWMDAAYPYIKSTQVFDCPSASTRAPLPTRQYQYPASRLTSGSYAIIGLYGNGFTASGCTASPCSMGWAGNMVKVQAPSETAWVMDSMAPNGGSYIFYHTNTKAGNPVAWPEFAGVPIIWSYPTGSGPLGPNTTSNGSASILPFRHLETSNVLYADGHVKSQKAGNLMTSRTPTNNGCSLPHTPFTAEPCYKTFMAF